MMINHKLNSLVGKLRTPLMSDLTQFNPPETKHSPIHWYVTQLAGFDDIFQSSGTISCLNIWNSNLTSQEMLEAADCSSRGDVYHLAEDTIYLHGNVTSFTLNHPDYLSQRVAGRVIKSYLCTMMFWWQQFPVHTSVSFIQCKSSSTISLSTFCLCLYMRLYMMMLMQLMNWLIRLYTTPHCTCKWDCNEPVITFFTCQTVKHDDPCWTLQPHTIIGKMCPNLRYRYTEAIRNLQSLSRYGNGGFVTWR